MYIAITGGTGFIGRRVVARHLSMGHHVRVLSRTGEKLAFASGSLEWLSGDLNDNGSDLERLCENVDILYHCAAEISDTERMQRINVDGTSRLIRAAQGRIKRWIQLSTCGIYDARKGGIIRENARILPCNAYESTKAAAESMLAYAASAGAFELSVLRPSIVFGEDMANNSLRAWIKMVRDGLFFYIGDAGAIVNYVYVDDVVEALVACAVNDKARGEIYNISDSCTVEDFVGAMCEALDRKPVSLRIRLGLANTLCLAGHFWSGFPLTRSRIEALTGRRYYSSDKIRRELSLFPKIGYREGLKRMMGKCKSN